MSTLEKITNVVVLTVALMMGTFVIHDRFFTRPQVQATVGAGDQALVGKQLSIPGVVWQAHDTNIVLAMSTECHFCTASTPFYKQLSERISRKPNDSLIMVLPQDLQTAQTYFNSHDIKPERIVSHDLSDLGVSGTPTLLIVNKEGQVTRSWVGKLPEADQTHVLDAL